MLLSPIPSAGAVKDEDAKQDQDGLPRVSLPCRRFGRGGRLRAATPLRTAASRIGVRPREMAPFPACYPKTPYSLSTSTVSPLMSLSPSETQIGQATRNEPAYFGRLETSDRARITSARATMPTRRPPRRTGTRLI